MKNPPDCYQKWKIRRLEAKINSLESENLKLKNQLKMIKARDREIHIQRRCRGDFL